MVHFEAVTGMDGYYDVIVEGDSGSEKIGQVAASEFMVLPQGRPVVYIQLKDLQSITKKVKELSVPGGRKKARNLRKSDEY
jgi:hypothetical protein